MFVNSDSDKALRMSGSACLEASEINIVGNLSDGSSCGPNPTPNEGANPQPDPLADVPSPAIGECDHVKFKLDDPGSVTPGVYCDGLELSSAGLVNFAPGEYILAGGGMTVSGGTSMVGTDVTFFNTAAHGYSFDGYNISGGSSTDISAPTTGDRAGMLFMEDRDVVHNKKHHFSGSSGGDLEGVIYVPNSKLIFSGGSNNTAYTVLVSNLLEISGPSYLGGGYGGGGGGGSSPIKAGVLVE